MPLSVAPTCLLNSYLIIHEDNKRDKLPIAQTHSPTSGTSFVELWRCISRPHDRFIFQRCVTMRCPSLYSWWWLSRFNLAGRRWRPRDLQHRLRWPSTRRPTQLCPAVEALWAEGNNSFPSKRICSHMMCVWDVLTHPTLVSPVIMLFYGGGTSDLSVFPTECAACWFLQYWRFTTSCVKKTSVIDHHRFGKTVVFSIPINV